MAGIRMVGNILRGRSTPVQTMMACLLGGVLGFIPGFVLPEDLGGGFLQAPGMILTTLALVLILNTNLAIFLVSALLAKIISMVFLPVSFALGQFLLDGPTQSFFQKAINSPGLAFFGLEYYATTGGIGLGFVFGFLFGLVLNRIIATYRRAMTKVEGKSKILENPLTRMLLYVVVGGNKGKATYEELLEKKVGNPIRIWGVVLVAMGGTGLYFGQPYLVRTFLPPILLGMAEEVSGATVEAESIEFDLIQGQMAVGGLQVADAQDLDRNLLSAEKLEAVVDTTEILRKRIVIDSITARGAKSGHRRETPGQRVERFGRVSHVIEEGVDLKTIEDYIEKAEQWKERLEQLEQFVAQLHGRPPEPIYNQETVGYAKVRASHLVEGAPQVLIRKVEIDDIDAEWLDNESLTLRAHSLSTQPTLVETAPRLELADQAEERIRFAVELGAAQGDSGKNRLEFALRNLKLEDISDSFKAGSDLPVRGGFVDLELAGQFQGPGLIVDLPLGVRLRNTTVEVARLSPVEMPLLSLPIHLRGSISNPSLRIDFRTFTESLLRSGHEELGRQLVERYLPEEKLEDLLGAVPVPEAVGGVVKDLAEEVKNKIPGLGGFLGGEEEGD